MLNLNPKKTGGAMMAPPKSRDYSGAVLMATLYDNFPSSFPHILTPTFVIGGTVPKLRTLVMHVGMAPKCDFVYKINAN